MLRDENERHVKTRAAEAHTHHMHVTSQTLSVGPSAPVYIQEPLTFTIPGGPHTKIIESPEGLGRCSSISGAFTCPVTPVHPSAGLLTCGMKYPPRLNGDL